MTIHKHNLSSTHLGQLSSLSRCASFESLGKVGGNSPVTGRSSASLESMLSSLATTPDYSPYLINTEVGDLLDADDLDLVGPDIIDDDKAEEPTLDTEDDYTPEDIHNIERVPTMYLSAEEAEGHGKLEKCKSMVSIESIDETSRYDPKKFDYREKWFICLIGLPASGKSTVVKQLINFATLNTMTKGNSGIRVCSFNAGDIRRKYERQENTKFSFNMDNASVQAVHEKYAFEALRQLTDALVNDTIDVGILDATNTTKERRSWVFKTVEKVSQESGIKINKLILEVKCINKSLRRFNIDKKADNQDYKGTPKEQAILDFLNRIERYEKVYERVTLAEIRRLHAKYFSITNAGESICYDCGFVHHDTRCHQNLTFKSAVLNLIYDFLISYRCFFAGTYLKMVDDFYTKGYYRPIFKSCLRTSSLPEKTSSTATKAATAATATATATKTATATTITTTATTTETAKTVLVETKDKLRPVLLQHRN